MNHSIHFRDRFLNDRGLRFPITHKFVHRPLRQFGRHIGAYLADSRWNTPPPPPPGAKVAQFPGKLGTNRRSCNSPMHIRLFKRKGTLRQSFETTSAGFDLFVSPPAEKPNFRPSFPPRNFYLDDYTLSQRAPRKEEIHDESRFNPSNNSRGGPGVPCLSPGSQFQRTYQSRIEENLTR